jgi:hypothetical protein
MQLKDAPAGPEGESRESGDFDTYSPRKCHCSFAAMGMLSPNYGHYPSIKMQKQREKREKPCRCSGGGGGHDADREDASFAPVEMCELSELSELSLGSG